MQRPARKQRLCAILQAAFTPLELSVEDDSAKHAGHAGAAGGMSHFRICIVAEAFRGLPAIERHRRIYAAVADLMQTEIHALAIDARVPGDSPPP